MPQRRSFLASRDGLGLQEPKGSFGQALFFDFWPPKAAPKRPNSASGRPRGGKSALPRGQKSARRAPKRALEAIFAFEPAFRRISSIFASQKCKKTLAKTERITESKESTPVCAWKCQHAYSLVKYSVPACSRKSSTIEKRQTNTKNAYEKRGKNTSENEHVFGTRFWGFGTQKTYFLATLEAPRPHLEARQGEARRGEAR